MRRGYAVAWLAWEGDMLPGDGRMVLDVPVASDNGKPITDRIRVEYIMETPGSPACRSAGGSPRIPTPRSRSTRATRC